MEKTTIRNKLTNTLNTFIMKKYFCEVNYQTNSGKPSTKTKVIKAYNSEMAFTKLHDIVKKYKYCLKIHGGNATEIES